MLAIFWLVMSETRGQIFSYLKATGVTVVQNYLSIVDIYENELCETLYVEKQRGITYRQY
jgi:hypothetical protein